MIDIHTHILPGIDDGSRNTDCSVHMLETLKNDNVTDVVFTPHFYWEHKSVNKFLESRANASKELEYPDIKFHFGAEVAFSELKIDYTSLTGLCIDSTNYMLLELPFSPVWSEKLFDNIFTLMHSTDIVPVIAHIERYPAANKKPENIAILLSLGCILQMNANTVIEAKPNSLADVLLKYRQIQAFGTDCHNMAERKPRYKQAFDKIISTYGKDYADYIQSCMNNILSDKQIKAPDIHHIKKGLISYK